VVLIFVFGTWFSEATIAPTEQFCCVVVVIDQLLSTQTLHQLVLGLNLFVVAVVVVIAVVALIVTSSNNHQRCK
jgi:hypothetical protein